MAPPPTPSRPEAKAAKAGGAAGVAGTPTILVSPRQRGNPLLPLIQNVAWKFSQVQPDFVLGDATCALFLSLRYHLLHPDYLYSRIAEVRRDFKVRVVLCVVDVANSNEPLLLLTSLASANDFTVILCWTLAECARYLETFKAFERRSASAIQEKLESEYMPRLEDTLTVIRSVNRSDVRVLSRNFGSLKNLMGASMEELALCSGIGEKKVRRLHQVFNRPFLAPE